MAQEKRPLPEATEASHNLFGNFVGITRRMSVIFTLLVKNV